MNRFGLIATIAFIVSACGKLPVEGNAQQIVTKTIVDSSYIVKADSLEQIIAKLDTLSPLKTLSRGYAIISNDDGKIIKSAKNLKSNDNIKIKLMDGEKNATIN